MAYALSQQTNQRPPGTLPCPDTDGDGLGNYGPINCTNRLGIVPFRDLGIEKPVDASGAPLWYVVETNYTNTYAATPAPPFRNSSQSSTLTLLMRAISSTQPQKMAFILIAPESPLTGQNRTNIPLSGAATFLEGVNASGGFAFDDLQNASQNDQLLGMPLGLFWSTIEKFVLDEVRTDIRTYQARCNSYPVPVPYGNNNDYSSLTTLNEGRIPLGAAKPFAWGGTNCPLPTSATKTPSLPPWLAPHWTRMLYYAVCPTATPLCLTLNGTTPALKASVIAIAPGIPLTATVPIQNRPPPTLAPTIANFFEGENVALTLPSNNIFDNKTIPNHTATANDLITIIAP
jgi:hypothetical protein